MRLLLDTNVIIWELNRSKELKQAALDIMQAPDNELFCSAVTIWEISIKQSIGKLKVPDTYVSILNEQNVKMLDITAEHAYAVRSLPRLHGDPFDRILVVQAQLEDLTIMTHDKHIAAYSVPCVMV